jgi:hypothetical protein
MFLRTGFPAAFLLLLSVAFAGCGVAHEVDGTAGCTRRNAAETPRMEAAAICVPDDYPSIQQAIDAAADGGVIVVRPGQYDENLNFKGKEITLRSTDPDDPQIVASTIIYGNGKGTVVIFAGGEGSGTVLAGFTISGGSGSMLPGYHGCFGGGILVCNGSAPLIEKNVIRDNSTGAGAILRPPGFGGGIAVLHASPCIVGNRVIHNSAEIEGGGIFILASEPVIEGNTIGYNRARIGGGLAACNQSRPMIIGNVIYRNSAIEGGGVNLSASPAYLLDNQITGNRAEVYGGGVSVWRSNPVIEGNTFEQNSARIKGGAICLSRDSLVRLKTRWSNTFRRNRPDHLFYQPSEFS